MENDDLDVERLIVDERDDVDLATPVPETTPFPAPPVLTFDPSPEAVEESASGVLRLATANRLMHVAGRSAEAVPDCRVTIGGLEVRTNGSGTTTVDLGGLPDGLHTIDVMSADTIDATPGPNVPADTARARAWRPFSAHVEKSGNQVTPASSDQPIVLEGDHLLLLLTPLWMRSGNTSARSGSQPVDLILMHHTGSNSTVSDLNTLVNGSRASAHYLIAPDGTVVKLVDEARGAWHAGFAEWAGEAGVNARSVGIELTHATGRDYPEAQIDSALALVETLFAAFPEVTAQRLIAHSDTAVNRPANRPPKRHGRKSTDPGSAFPWERFEERGWGLIPLPGVLPAAAYGGFFQAFPEGRLRSGDSDTRQRYDGAHRPDIAGAVAELQADLAAIGYHVGQVDGAFGTMTHWALQMFQQHVFSGSRRLHPENSGDGRCDQATAGMIKRVLDRADPPLVG